MPSYDYRCRACGSPFEIVTSMTDARENVTCPGCQSADVARQFAPVGIIGAGGMTQTAAASTMSAMGCGSGGCGHAH